VNIQTKQNIQHQQHTPKNQKPKLPQQHNAWEMSAQDALRVNYLTLTHYSRL